jgi:hypothetical protein
MTPKELLKKIDLGQRVAEEEIDKLADYFVETDQWRRIFNGDIDIIYGPKGSGKSAIYTLLTLKKELLLAKNILIISAETPRGATIFKDIAIDPPTSEREFELLWKLYFLSIIGTEIKNINPSDEGSKKLIKKLEEANLIDSSIKTLLSRASKYVKNLLNIESVSGEIKVDPTTGQFNGLGGSISLRDPNSEQSQKGVVSIDQLITLADQSLLKNGKIIWIAIDRLDIAFSDSGELEENALRALFRVYSDLLVYKKIKLKIFLRTDIWRKITKEGFREASHITRHLTIEWSEAQILNLIIRRFLNNESIEEYYSISKKDFLSDFDKQRELFYKIFPGQVEVGSKKPDTFKWILTRTSDGSKLFSPREIIHLLNKIKEEQIKRLEIGSPDPENNLIFDKVSFKEALPEVSRTRLEQTLYAEYPNLKNYIEKLDSEKTQQNISTLSKIWVVNKDEALIIANKLFDVGFFEKRGAKQNPTFWIPFIYRPVLNLVQGEADE